jgi:glucokinase
MTDESIILGVDIGGSHITAALVDMNDRSVIESSWRRSKIQSGDTAGEIITGWSAVIRESLLSGSNSGRISIAMPGPFDYGNGISMMLGQGKYDALYRLNVKEALLQKLGELATDILFVNDATCFLQGEAFEGAGKGHNHIIGFTLGTGFGSATFRDGLAEDADYWRYSFLESICEDYFSSGWFIRRYFELTGYQIRDVKQLIEDHRNIKKVNQVFEEFSENLDLFLSEIRGNGVRYDCVILGGNIANAYPFFLSKLTSLLKARSVNIPVLISNLGENAALIGAAAYSRSQVVRLASCSLS